MPTIEQRIASAERELRYLSEFLVKVLSDTEQLPSLQALESQFTEGLKLVVRIRALKDAQSARARKGRRRDEAGAQDVLDDRSSGSVRDHHAGRGRLFVDRDGKRYACFESAYRYEYQTIGNNAHETKEDAIAHAKKMIAEKLASLDTQRAMLKKLAEEL